MDKIFIYLFFIIFPFGQIFHLTFNLLGIGISPQPIDLIVGAAALYAIFAGLKKPRIFKYFNNFLLAALFSFVISIFIFKTPTVIYGLLYFLRISAYLYFLIYVFNFVKIKKGNSKYLLDCLMFSSVISAIFGWIQFFMFPTIKPLFALGWDEHTFRLVGTFLDPTFLGLIVVFGLLITIHRCIVKVTLKDILITLFLFISLAFTYSRASYLAFASGALVIGFVQKRLKYILCLVLILMVIVFILPTEKNPSISLVRPFTNIAKVNNYSETLQIIKKFPVFGVGLNNMCLARNKFIGQESYLSHSCSGSDSSILFILATTGVVGLIIFIYANWSIYRTVSKNKNFVVLSSSLLAVTIHSSFSNSMFYPWIMGYLIIIIAINITD